MTHIQKAPMTISEQKQLLESTYGTIENIEAKLEAENQKLEYLNEKLNTSFVCVTSHNTILAIKMFERISHLVDLNEDKNLINISSVDHKRLVNFYTPKVAEKWLAEDTVFGNIADDVKVEKVLLSERELLQQLHTICKFEISTLIKTIEFFKSL